MTPTERLIRLAEILEARPAVDPSFDIHLYSCGLTACALGWGARDPVLNAEGLILCEINSRSIELPINDPRGAKIRIRDNSSTESFFGLNPQGPKREGDALNLGYTSEYFWLFHCPTYPHDPSAHDVAKRVRIILGERGA